MITDEDVSNARSGPGLHSWSQGQQDLKNKARFAPLQSSLTFLGARLVLARKGKIVNSEAYIFYIISCIQACLPSNLMKLHARRLNPETLHPGARNPQS